jgi:hypothetical protein
MFKEPKNLFVLYNKFLISILEMSKYIMCFANTANVSSLANSRICGTRSQKHNPIQRHIWRSRGEHADWLRPTLPWLSHREKLPQIFSSDQGAIHTFYLVWNLASQFDNEKYSSFYFSKANRPMKLMTSSIIE